jgi:hypothetical protein
MKKSILREIIKEEIFKTLKEVDISRKYETLYLDVDDIIDNLLKLEGVTIDNVDGIATKLFGVDPQENPGTYDIEFDYKNGSIKYGKLKPTSEGKKYLDKLYDLYEKKYKYDLFSPEKPY